MSQPKKSPPARRVRKVNVRGLMILGGVVLAVVVGYFPVKAWSNRGSRQSALAQAEKLAARGEIDLALRHLDGVLVDWPEDVSVLEAAAKLRAESPRSLDELIRAAALNDKLLRLDPDGPGRQETRRRLVGLWIRQGDAFRQLATARKDNTVEINESRYRAAVTVARQLIARGAKDAEAHRLLAQALDGVVISGDPKLQAEAIAEYEEALRLDPGDAASAERLARIDLESRGDPAGAIETLDALLKAKPASVDARLARYRHFGRAKQADRAKAELLAAIGLAPGELALRVLAAGDALRGNDAAGARAQLDAIPAGQQGDLRVRLLRGLLEAAEQHHDEAIDQWRKGLSSVGGSDQELTFQLAYALIQLGRLAEARPLVAQYQRLEAEDARSLGRYLHALFEQRSGRPARAIDELERIRDKVPEALAGELQLTLGRCHEALGDEARASLAYNRAVVASPRAAEPRRALARLMMARDPDGALDEIDRALAQSADDPSILYEAARLHLARQSALPPDRRDWSRLEEVLGQGERAAPASPGFRSLRAEYLTATGRAAEAVELLARSARGVDRKRPESWLAWASALEGQGRHDEALRILDEAAAPDAVGEDARFRIARAVILARAGRGQEARATLVEGRDRLPKAEQPGLLRAQGDLAREMGDRDAARDAYREWSRQAPESAEPGLSLLELGKLFDDDESSRLGQEILRAIGGDREPYGLAAQAIDLLRPERGRGGPPPAEKLDRADRLVAQLQAEAPQLPIGHLLRGSILEYREQLPEAAAAYRLALKGDGMTPALVGLVGVLTKLKRYDELAALQKRYEEQSAASRRSDLAVGFDRISAAAALKLGDKGRAEFYAAKLVEQLPDNLDARANLARLLDEMGKPREAEATLRALVDRRPDDPSAWIALVAFQAIRGQPGEAAATIARARSSFKGPKVELLLGRCHWLLNDLPAAAGLYDAALARHPEDPATLQDVAGFDAATGRGPELEAVLRRALARDPSASWAGRLLAMRLSSLNDPAAWAEAWSLVAPGSRSSGDSPEDRLIRATVLARSPEVARRAEAAPAMIALARDLPASHAVAIEARARLAQAMLDANRAAEAASSIAPVADDVRRANPTALALAVEALARSGQADQAQARLDRLVAIEPKSPRVTAARAWVLRARGQVAEAVAAIEAGVDEVGATPEGEALALAFYEMARKVGPEDAAARLAEKVAARWPRFAYLTARAQLERGRLAEALASCRVALEAGSPGEALRVATALAIRKRDDPAYLKEVDALADLARSKSPRDHEVAVFRATLRHLQGRYEEEVALYREALAMNPPSVLFLNNMAWTLSEGLGRHEEALGRIDEAIRRSGRAASFLDTRGVILARLGRTPEALADLELAAKAEPSPTTYFHLARTYLKAGKPEDHRRCRDLARAAKLDPKALDPTDRADLDEVMR